MRIFWKQGIALSVIICSMAFSFSTAHAETPVLNAGMVASIWYDNEVVVPDTTTMLHAGFYNESDSTVTGTAVFRIDDAVVGKSALTSKPRSIVSVSAEWKSTVGTHVVSVTLEEGDKAVSVPSVRSSLEVREVKKEELPKEPLSVAKVQTTVADTIVSLTEKADAYTDAVADNLQEQKVRPQKEEGKPEVLGASTEARPLSTVQTAKNASIDGLSWIVRNWQWGALGLLVLVFILLRRSNRGYRRLH